MTGHFPKQDESPQLGLEGDEVIEKKAYAMSFSGWGPFDMFFQVAGVLTLTERRLIWRAPGIDRWSWQVKKEEVTGVSVVPTGFGLFWRYTVLVKTDRKHRFEIGGEEKAEEWCQAIKQWANL